MTNAKFGTDGWDAVVVGAGHSGLTCAAYLAVAGGLRVLVVERQATVGGDEAAAVPPVYQGLGLDDQFRFWEPDGLDALPGIPARTTGGWDGYRARMVAALPDEAAQVCRYVDMCSALHAEIRGMDPEGQAAPSTLFVTCARRTLDQVMGDCGLSARARTVLGTRNGDHGLAPEQVPAVSHAAMLGDELLGDTGQVLASTLVEAIEAYGGEVRTRTPVVGVAIEAGQVTGVRTVAGDVLRAPVVVSDPEDGRAWEDLVGDGPARTAPVPAAGYRTVATAASADLVGRALLDYAEKAVAPPRRRPGAAPVTNSSGNPAPAGSVPGSPVPFGAVSGASTPAGPVAGLPSARWIVPEAPGLYRMSSGARRGDRVLDLTPAEAHAGRVYGSLPRTADPVGRIPRPRVRR